MLLVVTEVFANSKIESNPVFLVGYFSYIVASCVGNIDQIIVYNYNIKLNCIYTRYNPIIYKSE